MHSDVIHQTRRRVFCHTSSILSLNLPYTRIPLADYEINLNVIGHSSLSLIILMAYVECTVLKRPNVISRFSNVHLLHSCSCASVLKWMASRSDIDIESVAKNTGKWSIKLTLHYITIHLSRCSSSAILFRSLDSIKGAELI